MDSSTLVALVSLILAVVVVGCVVVARRVRNRGSSVRSSLELTPQGGWSLLNLVLANHSESKIWVERAAFAFAKLDAEMQSHAAAGHGSLQVREFIGPHENLRISLIEAVYNAAGKPQGVYEFEFLGAVRYQLDGKWIESEVPFYRVHMVRLSAVRLRKAGGKGVASHFVEGSAVLRSVLNTKPDPVAPASSQEALGRPELQTTQGEDLKKFLRPA